MSKQVTFFIVLLVILTSCTSNEVGKEPENVVGFILWISAEPDLVNGFAEFNKYMSNEMDIEEKKSLYKELQNYIGNRYSMKKKYLIEVESLQDDGSMKRLDVILVKTNDGFKVDSILFK